MLTELLEIERIICIRMDLALNNLQKLICHKTQPTHHSTVCKQNLYLYSSEFFELELFD